MTYSYLTTDFTLPSYQLILLYKHRSHPSHAADPAIHPVGGRGPSWDGSWVPKTKLKIEDFDGFKTHFEKCG